MANQVSPDDGEFRIVVCGKKGHGKSTVCNALLGKDHFAAGTTTEASDLGQCTKNGLTIKVVDTPDMTTAGMKQKEKKAEVARWKELAAPYASVLLLVIRSDVPYTEEDFIVYRQIRRFWGKGSARERLVVVFTFADGQDVDEVGERMESESPKWMGKIFKDSGGRFLVFKGKSSGNLLDEVMTDDDSDDEDDGEQSKGSGGGEGEGGGGGGGKGQGKCKAKGGRGRRRGHGRGHGRGGGGDGGIMGILCCICGLCKRR